MSEATSGENSGMAASPQATADLAPADLVTVDMATAISRTLKYNDAGLIPAIAQQFDSDEVLMMAWMNKQAIVETLTTGQVCYFSRSRGKLWRKGESSGHTQKLVEFRIDCDRDTILLLVAQTGPACHTNRHNCFFEAVRGGKLETIADPEV